MVGFQISKSKEKAERRYYLDNYVNGQVKIYVQA